MVQPLVTVAVCVKNCESTIKSTINSIINQDFPENNLEIFIVDGNSSDGTLNIIKNILLTAKRTAFFFSENKGLGFARQIVIDNSKAKYVIWADGDLVFSKNYIRKQYEFMEKNPKVAIAAGILCLSKDDNWIATLETIGYVVEGLRHVGKKTSNLLGTKGTFSRVNALRSIGGFDLNIKGSQEDIDLSYRLFQKGWIFYVNYALFYENQRTTWNEIWKRHVWYGFGLHFLQHKHPNLSMIASKPNDRIIFSSKAYQLTLKKIVFLLPFNFVFRKIALFFGYFKAHISNYGHKA